ncbi:hypothetical protein LY76DRAFT_193035 [Colletotrichum caudatum]|nr:hypothetical protein LY76DRAFT_193035 [Colletotrichum caudatum]
MPSGSKRLSRYPLLHLLHAFLSASSAIVDALCVTQLSTTGSVSVRITAIDILHLYGVVFRHLPSSLSNRRPLPIRRHQGRTRQALINCCSMGVSVGWPIHFRVHYPPRLGDSFLTLLPSKLVIVSLTSHGVVALSYLITIPGAPDSMRDCTKCQPLYL